jgi:simple sugar transport system permease protein
MMTSVNERVALIVLALVTALAVVFAPWAAINRETGARSAVVLLPERYVDFTGRTQPVELPQQGAVFVLTLMGLAAVVAGGALPVKARRLAWLAGGLVLVVGTAWGMQRLTVSVDAAKFDAFLGEVRGAIERPRPAYDVDKLEALLAASSERDLTAGLAEADAAGLVIRRLPYTNAGVGLSAFLAVVTGAFALLFGARIFRGFGQVLDRLLRAAAVPATAILLALLAAAVVILALQATPVGAGAQVGGAFDALVGRLDTLWYAYYSMFHDSLGTVNGFAESLKFATPLIFTGLAVAFGFQAGLFNIGAPGQMVMGAIFAMLAGVYMPGPRLVVLPVAVLSAALGGGLWGALPGWLKARFGANEVINTILLNFVAASVLLFILSAGNVFAAAAVRIFVAIGVFLVLVIAALLVPAVRRASKRAPRAAFAVGAVVLLAGCVVAGLPRAGDQPITVNMPFKVPGNEPKSRPLNAGARLPQLPAVLGVTRGGVNVVRIDYAAVLALLGAVVAAFRVGRLGRLKGWTARLVGALLVGGALYGLGALVGIAGVNTAIPPTKLNLSFLIALLMAVFVHVFLFKTRWGYELRAVGLSPRAAEYGGARIGRNTIMAMAISGALAGLTATHYVLGGALEDYALRQSIPTSDGFDGIAVALLGANQPAFIVASAFLFGVLKYGGSVLNITFPDLTRDVVSMILALVVLFIAAKGFLPERLTNPLKWGARQEPAALGAAEGAATANAKTSAEAAAREGAGEG